VRREPLSQSSKESNLAGIAERYWARIRPNANVEPNDGADASNQSKACVRKNAPFDTPDLAVRDPCCSAYLA
jgi:hypothetical protein